MRNIQLMNIIRICARWVGPKPLACVKEGRISIMLRKDTHYVGLFDFLPLQSGHFSKFDAFEIWSGQWPGTSIRLLQFWKGAFPKTLTRRYKIKNASTFFYVYFGGREKGETYLLQGPGAETSQDYNKNQNVMQILGCSFNAHLC